MSSKQERINLIERKMHTLIQKAILKDGVYLRRGGLRGSLSDENGYLGSDGGCCVIGALAVGVMGIKEVAARMKSLNGFAPVPVFPWITLAELRRIEDGFEGHILTDSIDSEHLRDIGARLAETYGAETA